MSVQKRLIIPLMHYVQRRTITPDQAQAGFIFGRIVARCLRVPFGSNAAMWEQALSGGRNSFGPTPSDPFLGQSSAFAVLDKLRPRFSATQWDLLLQVCAHEKPAGTRHMAALREALDSLIRLGFKH